MQRLPEVRYPGNVTGLLYEPRAFWSVARVDTSDNASGRVLLPRRDFYNGERFPVTLTKLCFAPVNYTFRRFDSGFPPTSAATYHNDGAAALNRSRLIVSAPQRQNYARQVIDLASWCPEPVWEPQIADAVDFASSLWNVVRWDFDKVMVIPRQGTMELQLSSISPPTLNGILDFEAVNFTTSFFEGPPPSYGTEAPGRLLFPGNARVHPRSILRYNTNPNGQLFGLDAFGFTPNIPPPALSSTQQYPPDQQLSAREFDRQNATVAGSSPVTGFAVHIDQIDHDLSVNDDFFAGPPGNPGGNPVMPLSLKVAAKARMANGGSGAWWWRPNAPLALVTPTITPAQVYELPVPITLGPGDTLEIELQTPGPVTIDANLVEPIYQVGVSLCGYAAIEG